MSRTETNPYSYATRFGVTRSLPEQGRPRDEVLDELRAMASEEDAFWETGRCSGTIYCGDHEHYAFLNDAFGLFAHVIFTPWLNGERSPVDDRRARAGFHNVSVHTQPEDIVRAVLEGVAYNDRWLHEAVESFAKRRLDPIRRWVSLRPVVPDPRGRAGPRRRARRALGQRAPARSRRVHGPLARRALRG